MSIETYTHLVPTPKRSAMNSGLSPARVETLIDIFGEFPGLTNDCGPVKNARVAKQSQTRDLGPFRATGIRPALSSLETVMDEVKAAHPLLWGIIGTEGMLCYRRVRGSSKPSNHAAGTAIDIKIGGVLPEFNAAMVPFGYVVLYGYFHRHGWFWAAGYNGRRDPMHFEIADETLRKWHASGTI
jgi:hypothetical protein